MTLEQQKELIDLFEEPTQHRQFGISATQMDFIRDSQHQSAQAVRAEIRAWLKEWTFGDQKDTNDLFSRLRSKDESQVESALWEVYLNWAFKQMGYTVTRQRQAETGNVPDFIVEKADAHFAIEAIAKNRFPKSSPQNRWSQLSKYIDNAFRSDFFISMRPVNIPRSNPKLKAIRDAIFAYLDSDDLIDGLNERVISIDDWKVAVSAFPKKSDSQAGPILGMLGSASSGLVTDQQDLKKLAKKKRKRYGSTQLPLLVAVLENTTIPGDTRFHRLGALYGSEAVQLGNDGTTRNVRLHDGLWSPHKADDQLVGLLLLDRLAFNADFSRIELWTRPNADTSELGDFASWFRTISIRDDALVIAEPMTR